ncbi:rhamnulokinase [Rhodococcoides yunnanense]|uniref:rhamnulokinase n=1 Tax=Rhodococcoides yunnanense TaxID=278209 RepID=UPI0009352296|nr:rhamnulokinase family protein [Rhodococcus yunnanensis]
MAVFAAVDLGASSGRVMLGRVTAGSVVLEEVARFENRPVRLGRSLHWNVTELYQGVLDGIRTVVAGLDGERLTSIGIDTWAVDYGLLAADGSLLGVPYHYRDARNDTEHADLFLRNGIAHLPFNTVYQLLQETDDRIQAAHRMLMMPDLLAYWLTGVAAGEVTNASTSGMLDPRAREWDSDLVGQLGLKADLLPPLLSPGDRIGELTPGVAQIVGADATVVAVGTHDTASAIVAVPAESANFAYIVSGTWSLVGVETTEPVVTEQARDGGFTNEAGVDGTVRLLRNVMGMWLVQESLRQWERDGVVLRLGDLLEEAAGMAALGAVVDPDLPVFLPPGDMPTRIARECERVGCAVPSTPAETIRAIMDSLAAAYARSVATAGALAGIEIDTVHIVGGGSQNRLLCQLTADATGLPVVAGPVEGSALGNVLVQARAAGVIDGGLAELRGVVRESFELRRYLPVGG